MREPRGPASRVASPRPTVRPSSSTTSTSSSPGSCGGHRSASSKRPPSAASSSGVFTLSRLRAAPRERTQLALARRSRRGPAGRNSRSACRPAGEAALDHRQRVDGVERVQRLDVVAPSAARRRRPSRGAGEQPADHVGVEPRHVAGDDEEPGMRGSPAWRRGCRPAGRSRDGGRPPSRRRGARSAPGRFGRDDAPAGTASWKRRTVRTAMGSPLDGRERLVAAAHARGAPAGEDDAGGRRAIATWPHAAIHGAAVDRESTVDMEPPRDETEAAAWIAKRIAGLEAAADCLAHARYVIALTGAGLSVESGIPPFRGPGGPLDQARRAADERLPALPRRSRARRGRTG